MITPLELITLLKAHANSKSHMAQLKALGRGQIDRAWQIASTWGIISDPLAQQICAWFALHPKASTTTFGAFLRQLRNRRGASFEVRVTRLLSAQTSEELIELMPSVILMAKGDTLGIPYANLLADLRRFTNNRSAVIQTWIEDYS